MNKNPGRKLTRILIGCGLKLVLPTRYGGRNPVVQEPNQPDLREQLKADLMASLGSSRNMGGKVTACIRHALKPVVFVRGGSLTRCDGTRRSEYFMVRRRSADRRQVIGVSPADRGEKWVKLCPHTVWRAVCNSW